MSREIEVLRNMGLATLRRRACEGRFHASLGPGSTRIRRELTHRFDCPEKSAVMLSGPFGPLRPLAWRLASYPRTSRRRSISQCRARRACTVGAGREVVFGDVFPRGDLYERLDRLAPKVSCGLLRGHPLGCPHAGQVLRHLGKVLGRLGRDRSNV